MKQRALVHLHPLTEIGAPHALLVRYLLHDHHGLRHTHAEEGVALYHVNEDVDSVLDGLGEQVTGCTAVPADMAQDGTLVWMWFSMST